MKETISLSSLLGVFDEETNSQQKAPKQKNRQISLDYLTTLNDLFGAKSAVAIAREYTAKDIAQMEAKYDKFRFDSQPKTPKGKLERVLKFLEWQKKNSNVTSMSYYMENITESFSGFETLVKKMIATEDINILEHSTFFLDQLYCVARGLLFHYGVKPTAENKKTGHLAIEVYGSPKKVVPGITTDELVNFCIEKKVAGTPANDYAIVKGFDDARTALEVSVMIGDSSDIDMYIKYGFTSLSQVQSLDLDKLFALENVFDSMKISNQYKHNAENFESFVSSYINGNPKRIEEILDLAYASGQDYLVAFDGNVKATQRILKIAEEERPSAKAVQYAIAELKAQEFEDVIAIAKEIDTPHRAVFRRKFATKKEFMDFRDDYQANLDDFVKKTGATPNEAGDVPGFLYDKYKAFKGDPRFLSDGFPLHLSESIAKIEKLMDFDTYQSLNLSLKPILIPALIDEGYKVEEMQEAFGCKTEVNGYQLEEHFKELKDTMSLTEMVDVISSGLDTDYAVSMLAVVPFKKEGIPYGLLSSLESHDVKPTKFREFINTVGVNQYKSNEEDSQTTGVTTPIFDAVNMIKDFKIFYNQNAE
jgi:hypothetical protein